MLSPYETEARIKRILPTCKTNAKFNLLMKRPLLIFRGGHGGRGGGAKTKQYEEWAQNYQMAEAFFTYCVEHEIGSVWLNPNAWELPNWLREGIGYARKITRELRCPTIFFSIHHNASRYESANGFEVLYPEGSGVLEQVADDICNAVKTTFPQLSKRGAKPRENLYELKPYTFDGPALIIECGFLTNEHDMGVLDNGGAMYNMASAVIGTLANSFTYE